MEALLQRSVLYVTSSVVLIDAQRRWDFDARLCYFTILPPVLVYVELWMILWQELWKEHRPSDCKPEPCSPTDSTSSIEEEVQREDGERKRIIDSYLTETSSLEEAFKQLQRDALAARKRREDAALTIQRVARADLSRRVVSRRRASIQCKNQRTTSISYMLCAVCVVCAVCAVLLAYVRSIPLTTEVNNTVSAVGAIACFLLACAAWYTQRSASHSDPSPPSAVMNRYVDHYKQLWITRCMLEWVLPFVMMIVVNVALWCMATFVSSLCQPTGWNVLGLLLGLTGLAPLMQTIIFIGMMVYPAVWLLLYVVNRVSASLATVHAEYGDWGRASVFAFMFRACEEASPEEQNKIAQVHRMMTAIPAMRQAYTTAPTPGSHQLHMTHPTLLQSNLPSCLPRLH